jgi:SAM-dependent methyltransferase
VADGSFRFALAPAGHEVHRLTSRKELFTYRFEAVGACIMCGSGSSRVLGRRLDRHQGLRPRHRKAVATTVVQCGECRLIYADPRPIPELIAEHYDTPPEDYWVAAYFDEDPGYFQLQARSFDRLWRGSGTPRALDVGAGIGKAMRALARHGFDVRGLEPSRPFYDRAISSGVSADRLRLAPIEDVDYGPDTFDLVSFGAVLEHLRDPAAAIERALRWLAPGGLIHAEVPSARWLMGRLLNLVYRAQGLDYVTNLSPMHAPYHLYEFTPLSFRRHGRRAGYELVEHTLFAGQTFMPRPIDAVATRVMDATGTGMQLEVWLARPTPPGWQAP